MLRKQEDALEMDVGKPFEVRLRQARGRPDRNMAGIVDQIAESLRALMITQGLLNFFREFQESVYCAYVEMKRYGLFPKGSDHLDEVFCFRSILAERDYEVDASLGKSQRSTSAEPAICADNDRDICFRTIIVFARHC